MGVPLTYNEIVTFYRVKSSGYRGTKVVEEFAEVPCVFVQNTGMAQANYQENVDADALCWPELEDDFIVENANRLEGMYILANLFGGENSESWFKVDSIAINRDHLLNNEIDNLELRLKKTTALPNVS